MKYKSAMRYLPIVFLSLSCFLRAQSDLIGNPVLRFPFKTIGFAEKSMDEMVFIEEKVPGAVLFSANFSNSINTWTPYGPDGALWMIDNNGPSGQFANPSQEIINSQSANNGFLIFDADLSNPGAGPYISRNGSIASPAIDLTGISAAILEFQQRYRFCCNVAFFPKVEVSTYDFVTMATFDASIEGVESGIVSPSAMAKINLKSFLDTATNLSNFKFRFTFNGTGGTTHYYWQIDDVKLKEAYLYDLRALDKRMEMGEMKLSYYYIPTSQIAPITFSGVARADGSLPHTNAQLNVSINFGGGSASSPLGISMNPTETDTLYTDPWIAPSGVDTFYTATCSFTQDSIDGWPGDNDLSELFYITEGIYSVDNNTYKDYISNLVDQPNQPFKVGNVMEVMADDMIDSILVGVTSTSTNIGQYVFAEVHKRVNGNWQYLGSTAPTQITQLNNGGFVRMPMMYATPLLAGDTILLMSCHSGSVDTDVRFRLAQRTDEGNVLGYDANGTLFYLPNPRSVIIRARLKGYLNVDERKADEMDFRVFPNPTTRHFNLLIKGSLKENVELTIVDAQGRTCIRYNINLPLSDSKTHSLDVSSLQPGYYRVFMHSSGIARSTALIIE